MNRLVLQMIDEEEKQVRPNIRKRKKNYNGNLVELRRKREKLLLRKHNLNLEIKKYNKMSQEERDSIFSNIERLSIKIETINKEIEKIQMGMQNSSQWMEGDYEGY